MDEAIAQVGEIARSTLAQRHATTAMVHTSEVISLVHTSEVISQRVEAEDRVIQDVRSTLSALADNAHNTRRLLDGFHV